MNACYWGSARSCSCCISSEQCYAYASPYPLPFAAVDRHQDARPKSARSQLWQLQSISRQHSMLACLPVGSLLRYACVIVTIFPSELCMITALRCERSWFRCRRFPGRLSKLKQIMGPRNMMCTSMTLSRWPPEKRSTCYLCSSLMRRVLSTAWLVSSRDEVACANLSSRKAAACTFGLSSVWL